MAVERRRAVLLVRLDLAGDLLGDFLERVAPRGDRVVVLRLHVRVQQLLLQGHGALGQFVHLDGPRLVALFAAVLQELRAREVGESVAFLAGVALDFILAGAPRRGLAPKRRQKHLVAPMLGLEHLRIAARVLPLTRLVPKNSSLSWNRKSKTRE